MRPWNGRAYLYMRTKKLREVEKLCDSHNKEKELFGKHFASFSFRTGPQQKWLISVNLRR